MPHLTIGQLPETLRDPIFIASFGGWNDAGEAATAAVRWLVRQGPGKKIGEFDPEPFHVFTETRPSSRFVNGDRRIQWPAHDLFLVRNEKLPNDFLLLVAREPELRWRTYCTELIDTARTAGCGLLVSLGAFLADTPHSRPAPLTGFASDETWAKRLLDHDIGGSQYQGPTGIVGVLHDFCRRADFPSLSVWAAVPHYLPNTANPKAAFTLLSRVAKLLDIELDLTRLRRAADFFESRVNEAVARDRRAGNILRDMERRADSVAGIEAESGLSGDEEPAPLPSAAEVIRDLEEFLRGRSAE